MAIGRFQPMFTQGDVRRMVQTLKERLSESVLQRLLYIGEQFIVDARNSGTYTDRTGNLRSSIGYLILRSGVHLAENFHGKADEGRQRAKSVALSIEPPQGYVLIVVAGMDYAAAVEARGYDVLTSSSIRAEKSLKKAITTLQKLVA